MIKSIAARRAFLQTFGFACTLSALTFGTVESHAAESVSIAVVSKGSSLEWPLYIADKKGFFAAHGIKADMVSASSSAAVQQWLASKSVKIGVGGLVDPLRAIDKGARISLLRTEAQTTPYALMAKPTIASMADLRGKTVSLGGAKDITRIYFERMVASVGLKPGNYDQIYAGATSARFAALQGGVVDAAILQPPFNFRAANGGFKTVGYAATYSKDFPFTGYAVNTEWAHANRPVLLNFLAALTQAVDWFYADANRDEAIGILVDESSDNRTDVAQTYDLFRKIRIFDRKGVIEARPLGNLVDALKTMGDIESGADAARFMDPEVVGLAAQTR